MKRGEGNGVSEEGDDWRNSRVWTWSDYRFGGLEVLKEQWELKV